MNCESLRRSTYGSRRESSVSYLSRGEHNTFCPFDSRRFYDPLGDHSVCFRRGKLLWWWPCSIRSGVDWSYIVIE